MTPSQFCAQLYIEGENSFVLNVFIPCLLQNYTRSDHSLAVSTMNADLARSVMRERFFGSPEPPDAAPRSLRNELYTQRRTLGLSDVSFGTERCALLCRT
jgi:hypothetical protein